MEPTIDNETANLIEKRHGRDWLSYVGFKVPDINQAIDNSERVLLRDNG